MIRLFDDQLPRDGVGSGFDVVGRVDVPGKKPEAPERWLFPAATPASPFPVQPSVPRRLCASSDIDFSPLPPSSFHDADWPITALAQALRPKPLYRRHACRRFPSALKRLRLPAPETASLIATLLLLDALVPSLVRRPLVREENQLIHDPINLRPMVQSGWKSIPLNWRRLLVLRVVIALRLPLFHTRKVVFTHQNQQRRLFVGQDTP